MESTEKTVNKLLVVIVLIAIVFYFLGVLDSNHKHKKELNAMEKRALKMEQKDCYTWQEIEIILFNEIQE